MTLWRLLRQFLKPYRYLIVAVIVLQFFSTAGMLFLPSINADIIDKGIVRGDIAYIGWHGALMLTISILQVSVSIAAVWFGARIGMGVGRDLRNALFSSVTDYSSREIHHFGAASLINRTTNDVQQVQQLVVSASMLLVSAPLMSIGGVIMALREDAGLSWLMGVSVPVLVVAISLIIVRIVPQMRLVQIRLDAINRVLREQLAGIRVVRAFVRERREAERFERANQDVTDVMIRAGQLQALMFPTVILVLNASSVAVLWFGALRVDSGEMQIGALTAFLMYLLQILMSVMMATFMAMMIPRAAVCADRIAEVLATEGSVHQPTNPLTPTTDGMGVELREVSLIYPGASTPVLNNISFFARRGETTAIIGSTGAGKTTLISLIARLLDASSGSILIDEVDVRDLSSEKLSGMLGLVPQRSYLFSGSIASNLRYGSPAAPEELLWSALETAQAREFVEQLPDDLDARIEQGGTNLSGGQRQRLAIARALVAQPDIYLFDDSFSALDLATEARLRAALLDWTRDSVVVVVAQRVSSIVDADQIIVLDDGNIVGLGRHNELLRSCPTYCEIADSQLPAGVAP